MTTPGKDKKKVASRTKRSVSRTSPSFDHEHPALPQPEIRRLVICSTTRYKIEPFVRQMVRIMDNIRAGQIQRVVTLNVSKRDRSRAALITAISNAAREGRSMAAHETAFLAALYAYENSLNHLRAFLGYLDGFKKRRHRQR